MWYPQLGTASAMLTPGAAATAARTATLDCQDANYASIFIHFGAAVNTNNTGCTVSIAEGDDTNATSFATFDSDLNTTADNDAEVIVTRHVALQGRKRYLKLTITPDTTTNGPTETSAFGVVYKNTQSSTLAGDQVASAP